MFTSEGPTSQPSQTETNLAIRPKKKICSMLDLIPVIHKKIDISVAFPPSLPSRSEHSEAQLWHFVCFHTCLLVEDMQKPGCRFQVGLRSFLYQIYCSNFGMQRTFQASAQTLFDARFGINSHKVPTSFPLIS